MDAVHAGGAVGAEGPLSSFNPYPGVERLSPEESRAAAEAERIAREDYPSTWIAHGWPMEGQPHRVKCFHSIELPAFHYRDDIGRGMATAPTYQEARDEAAKLARITLEQKVEAIENYIAVLHNEVARLKAKAAAQAQGGKP